jgi:hypothetical protein
MITLAAEVIGVSSDFLQLKSRFIQLLLQSAPIVLQLVNAPLLVRLHVSRAFQFLLQIMNL